MTTPFTLARLLSCCCFLFVRLYHLVLDEADRLFTLAPEQVTAAAENILQPVVKFSSIFLTKPLLLLPDGHHPAALPEGDLQPGEEPLPSAARRRGQAVEQSHGPAGRRSHAVPLHRRRCSRGKRAVRKCAAGNVELFFFLNCIYFAVCLGLQEILKSRGKKKRD